jgi:hypothetical protein
MFFLSAYGLLFFIEYPSMCTKEDQGVRGRAFYAAIQCHNLTMKLGLPHTKKKKGPKKDGTSSSSDTKWKTVCRMSYRR